MSSDVIMWRYLCTAKLEELHKTVVREDQGCLPYTAEETSLLGFHFSNLEFACGADLSQVHLVVYSRKR